MSSTPSPNPTATASGLSAQERREIEAEFAHYPNRQALSVEALKIVQRHRGWVSDEALVSVAEALGMSREALEGVATFYNLIYRQPVGRHVILVCDSVSCWVLQSERLIEQLKAYLKIDALGQTSAAGRVTLLPMCCLGCCDGAPALLIDDDLHRCVDGDHLEQLLERYP